MLCSSDTGAGAGAGCGASCGTGTELGTGNLLYVGSGTGDFVAETTYRYVGVGRGDLAFAAQKRAWWPCILLLALLLVAVVVVFLMTPKGNSTTRQTVADDFVPPPRMPDPIPQAKVCQFWGDPHLKTFDGGKPSFYGEGEFWIIKNPRVKIQGRYAGTKYTLGLASTQKVAVGGSFIQGHQIEVEPMEAQYGGSIRVDGNVVLENFGTYDVGGARITYNDMGTLVDEATSQWGKKIVTMELPEGIRMEVFRWANYLDLRISQEGPLMGGQDGSCGNYNGDALDDTTPAIFSRIGPRVSAGELMFQRNTPVHFTRPMAEMLRTKCPVDQMSSGTAECATLFPAGAPRDQALYDACLFDYCFGEVEHALQVAKTLATTEELKDAGLIT
jgi:hypothetical protein